MSNKFDELSKRLAQSVTRRQALKRFGLGLAGMALAWFGLPGKAEAGQSGGCVPPKWCDPSTNPCCCTCKYRKGATGLPTCNPNYATCKSYCGSLVLGC